ncbi:hypothetical protein ACT17Q_06015 [Cellulomonas sp. CW35]|nr:MULTISPECIES: hypothetical protein [Cellulomonas]ASR54960.1 hypothetical protein CBP52_07455 [Cellulomonas sp. PSBB021]NII65391.1 hypothetical protein [Cellulomonas uda]
MANARFCCLIGVPERVVAGWQDRARAVARSRALDREQVTGTDLAMRCAYDDAGNVISAKDQPTAKIGKAALPWDNQCFQYDELRRLIQAWTAKSATSCAAPSTASEVGGAAPYWHPYTLNRHGFSAASL